jgi:LuxR family quorum sensing-dependent transcriptional regulator
MDAFRRAALDFFAGAAAAATLDRLIADFAPVAEAADCRAAACFHVARPGQPIAVRLMFGWGLTPQMRRQTTQRLSRQDEAVRALFMSSTPVAWSDLKTPRPAGDETPFDGLVVPVHGPLGEIMCVAVLGEPGRIIDPSVRMTLQLAATLLANRGASLVEIEAEAACDDRPSPREAECAALAGQGKSDWEIGRILGLSEDTVAFHMDRLKTKLDLSHRTEIPASVWLDTKRKDE